MSMFKLIHYTLLAGATSVFLLRALVDFKPALLLVIVSEIIHCRTNDQSMRCECGNSQDRKGASPVQRYCSFVNCCISSLSVGDICGFVACTVVTM